MTEKTWARVEQNLVGELASLPVQFTPGVNIYGSELNFVDVSAVTGIALLWVQNNGTFEPPQKPALIVPSIADLLSYASKKQNLILAQVWTFDVGTSDAPLKLTTKLDTAGQSAMTQLLVWSMAAQSGDTEPFSNVDYSSATITPAQAKNLALQAGAVKSASYACLNNLASSISASSPTITTEAQIDSASWPSPKS